MTWTGTTLTTKWRELTGRASTNDLSATAVLAIINDYYQENFPLEVDLDEIHADYTVEITATDDGEADLAYTTLDLNQPILANKSPLNLVHDPQRFFEQYPEDRDEHFITKPTLTIGTVKTKVLNAAFKYRLENWTRPKASVETALSGDDVPQGTYGAWLLSVDVDGTILITEAAENATGYATAALAVQGIVLPGSAYAIMGFVTAINSAAAFVPGTTVLDAETVTDTFTDGNPRLRSIPQDACITSGKLVIRPKPFDTFLIRASASLTAPTALITTKSPPDESWGPAIATGAAIKWLGENGGTERVMEIVGDPSVIGTHSYNIMMLNRKKIIQDSEREVIRSF